MKQFAVTLAGALLGTLLALGLFDHFVTKPREAMRDSEFLNVARTLGERPTATADLDKARTEAQQIATEVDASLQKSVTEAHEAIEREAEDQDKRRLAADAMSRASMHRVALTEYYQSNMQWPASAEEAGLPSADADYGRAVQSIKVSSGGRVMIVLKPPFAPGNKVTLTPKLNAHGMVEWLCAAEGDPDLRRYAPTCTH